MAVVHGAGIAVTGSLNWDEASQHAFVLCGAVVLGVLFLASLDATSMVNKR